MAATLSGTFGGGGADGDDMSTWDNKARATLGVNESVAAYRDQRDLAQRMLDNGNNGNAKQMQPCPDASREMTAG